MGKNKKLTYEELLHLKQVNEKIIDALIYRVEAASDVNNNSFSLFEGNISLAKQVSLRTEELRQLTLTLEKQKRRIELANDEADKAYHYKKTILDSMSDCLFITDQNGYIVDINKMVLTLFNQAEDNILNSNIRSYIDFPQQSKNKIDDLLDIEKINNNSNDYNSLDILLKISKTEILNGLLSISILKDKDSEFFKFIFLIRDVTELKKIESLFELERAKSLNASRLASLGQMAGGIAHEINNPLAIIATSMDMLQKASRKEMLSPELIEEITSDVSSTLKRISKIITGLRTVSRESNEFEKKMVATEVIFDDVLGLCSEKFLNYGVDLITNLQEMDIPHFIYCDRLQLSQVLLNLIGNAFDAVQECNEKWVQIHLSETQGEVIISITDSGSGITNELKDKIFEPFYTSKDIGKGTGLGLSISKGIIDKHNGQLIIDEKNKNTCFVVKLPKKDLFSLKEVV